MAFIEKIYAFFKESDERAKLLRKNIIQIFIYRTINVLVSFLIVPITINYLNSYEYGIWLTLSSFMVWIELMDLGIANGLRNKLTESIALNNMQLSKEYVSSAYFFLALIASLLFLIYIIVSKIVDLNELLNLRHVSNLDLIITLVVFFFCLRFITKTIGTILIADHKPNIDALLSAIGSLISLIIIYILTKYTKGTLLIVSTIFSALPLLVYLFASLKIFNGKYKHLSPSLKFIKLDLIKDLLNIGIRFFIIQLSCLLIFSSINFLIIRWFGAEAVTQYNVAYKYFYTIILAFTIVVTPLWSAFSDAFVKGDFDWIKSTVKKVEKIGFLLIVVSVLLVLFSNKFYKLWIGDTLAMPISITISVCIYVIIFILLSTYNYVINGSGKVYVQTIISLIALILFIPVSYLLSFYFELGFIGVIYSSALMQFLLLFTAFIQYKKIINGKLSGIWNK